MTPPSLYNISWEIVNAIEALHDGEIEEAKSILKDLDRSLEPFVQMKTIFREKPTHEQRCEAIQKRLTDAGYLDLKLHPIIDNSKVTLDKAIDDLEAIAEHILTGNFIQIVPAPRKNHEG